MVSKSTNQLATVTAFIALAVSLTTGLTTFVIADRSKDALCNLRANVSARVVSSETYLKNHPNGAPALGLTAKEIRASIKRDRTTVNALGGLHCD